MSQKEYLQLVQHSKIFKKLDSKTQNIILKSQGASMQTYVQLFKINQKINDQNKKDFLKNIKTIYQEFIVGLKPIAKKINKIAENVSKLQDELNEVTLLNSAEDDKA